MTWMLEGMFGEFFKFLVGAFLIFAIIFGTICFISSRSEHNYYYLRPTTVTTKSGDIGEMSGSVCVQRYLVCYDRFLNEDRVIAAFESQEEAIDLFTELEYGKVNIY
jgi:hypothetical protein